MNDNFQINKLNNENFRLKIEIEKIKSHNLELEKSLLKLPKEYNDLKNLYSTNSSRENEYQLLSKESKLKDKKILDLEEKILQLKVYTEKEKKDFAIKYRKDVDEIKYLCDKLNLRNENSIKIEKLNNLLYNHILKLETIVQNFEKDEKKRAEEKEIQFETKMNDLKLKMLNFIKKGKIEKDHKEQERFHLLEKLSKMNKNSLLNELEFESLQLEDMLKQRKHLDNLIFQMKNDLNIHKQVEKILVEKNKKYIDMIRLLSMKQKYKVIEDDIDSKNETNNFFQKNNKTMYNERNNSFNIMNKKEFNKTQSESKKFNILNNIKINNRIINTSKKKDKSSYIVEKVNLQNELKRKSKDIEYYKNNSEFYKAKLNLMINKCKNILKLFDEGLEEIYKNNLAGNLKEIYFDIEEFKTCEFEKLTNEKKYSILSLLIQFILPLIKEEDLSNLKNVKHLNAKFYFGNTLDNSLKTDRTSNYFNRTKINKNKLNEVFGNINDIGFKTVFSKRMKNTMDSFHKSNSTLFSKISSFF